MDTRRVYYIWAINSSYLLTQADVGSVFSVSQLHWWRWNGRDCCLRIYSESCKYRWTSCNQRRLFKNRIRRHYGKGKSRHQMQTDRRQSILLSIKRSSEARHSIHWWTNRRMAVHTRIELLRQWQLYYHPCWWLGRYSSESGNWTIDYFSKRRSHGYRINQWYSNKQQPHCHQYPCRRRWIGLHHLSMDAWRICNLWGY